MKKVHLAGTHASERSIESSVHRVARLLFPLTPPLALFPRSPRVLGQVDVERVDFLEPRVPQEEWASIRGHPVVGPEATGMQAASLL
jgi:hypothetical protein